MNEILHTLKIETYSGYPVADKPTNQMLDDFEATFNFKLPLSYREYALEFGPGELGGFYEIFVPRNDDRDGRNDLAGWNRWSHEGDQHIINQYGDEELVKRVIYFCKSGGKDHIAWDPQDVIDPIKHEYGIYAFPDGWDDIQYVCDTFDEFISALFEEHLAKTLGFDEGMFNRPKTFQRWIKEK